MKIRKKRAFIVFLVFCIALILISEHVLWKYQHANVLIEKKRRYDNALAAIRQNEGIDSGHACPERLTFRTIQDLHICGDVELGATFDLVLFTTIYYSESHILFFTNTMNVLASLQNDHHMKGIVFIEHLRHFKENNASQILATACQKDLLVLLVPQCNQHGFPVFKSMFNVTMETWDARWYGYMNGDMLFDETLLSTIQFVESQKRTVQMIAGRRYNLRVCSNFVTISYDD